MENDNLKVDHKSEYIINKFSDYDPTDSTHDVRNYKINLSLIKNIFLLTDGTVTKLLEYFVQEHIHVEKHYQNITPSRSDIPKLHRSKIDRNDSAMMVRKIFLTGKASKKRYIYAESTVLLDSLPDSFRTDLIRTDVPIGKLWSKHRLETYKTDFTAYKSVLNHSTSKMMGLAEDYEMTSRTYSVHSNGRMSMIITEYFSPECFTH